jgi:hypothetical protein
VPNRIIKESICTSNEIDALKPEEELFFYRIIVNCAVRVVGETWQPTCSCENEGRGLCTVLDPFAGSGTTLWVAEHYGRDSIGIELSPEYCELIKKRMNNFQQTIFQGVTV